MNVQESRNLKSQNSTKSLYGNSSTFCGTTQACTPREKIPLNMALIDSRLRSTGQAISNDSPRTVSLAQKKLLKQYSSNEAVSLQKTKPLINRVQQRRSPSSYLSQSSSKHKDKYTHIPSRVDSGLKR